MRPREYLDAVRDRVLAEIRANPPTGPLLTEKPARPLPDACKAGHVGMMVRHGPNRRCSECERLRKAARRKEPRP